MEVADLDRQFAQDLKPEKALQHSKCVGWLVPHCMPFLPLVATQLPYHVVV